MGHPVLKAEQNSTMRGKWAFKVEPGAGMEAPVPKPKAGAQPAVVPCASGALL